MQKFVFGYMSTMITKMQSQANVAVVPQSVTTQPQSQQIVGVGVSANAVILKMSDIQQISTVGTLCGVFIMNVNIVQAT